MNRREAITTLAMLPLVAASDLAPPAEAPIWISHELRFRRSADAEDIFDEKAPIAVGTVIESFHEQWERGQPTALRLFQKRGRPYRVVGKDEKASFIFRNSDDDPLAIRLIEV